MWKYIRQYQFKNTLVIGLLLVINLVGTSFAFIQMYLGRLIFAGEFVTLVKVMLLNVLLVLTRNYIIYREKCLEAKVIAEMNCALRKDISQAIVDKSIQDFDQTESGEYISWFTNEVKEAETQGFLNFYSCINLILELLLGAAALIFIRVELLIATLFVSALTLYVSNHFGKKVERFSKIVAEAMIRYTNDVKEQIAGIDVLRAFGLSSKFYHDMHNAGENLEEERYQYVKKKGIENTKLMVLNVIGVNIINIMTFILCTLRIIAPDVIFGSVNLTNQVGNSFSGLLQKKIQLAGAKPFFSRFHDEKRTQKEQLPPLQKEIQVVDLTFCYDHTPVLNHLDLNFKAGGKYAIIGQSGCGKSTLLKLLSGQITDYKGKILFDDQETAIYDSESFYRQMAYIEQNVFLFNTSIRDNITLGASFEEREFQQALRNSALLKDIDKFPEGCDTMVGENGRNLSGGQKQRIAIARAFIHRKSVLLIDEGTSALDKENANLIEESLLDCKDLTLIMVTHHLREEDRNKYDAVYRLQGTAER